MNRLVYLAGPVTGVSHEIAANGWRKEAKKLLLLHNIDAISPLRTQEYLEGCEAIDFGSEGQTFGTQRAIMKQDHFDVCRSAVIFADLRGVKARSAGTIMELGWAWDRQKPVVVVMEEHGNPHDMHPMILEAIDWRVTDLLAGVDIVRRLIGMD
jgi:nucleoside 2-deoxyribosyltransferase